MTLCYASKTSWHDLPRQSCWNKNIALLAVAAALKMGAEFVKNRLCDGLLPVVVLPCAFTKGCCFEIVHIWIYTRSQAFYPAHKCIATANEAHLFLWMEANANLPFWLMGCYGKCFPRLKDIVCHSHCYHGKLSKMECIVKYCIAVCLL